MDGTGDDTEATDRDARPGSPWHGVPRALRQRILRHGRRLARRAGLLAALYAALLVLSGAGPMSAGFALLVMLAVTAAAAALPDGDDLGPGDDAADDAPDPVLTTALAATRASATSLGRSDGWRLVVDALPEPAVALDRLGQVAHANALMRELFPRIRDGVPFSHVTRHPDLMDAIDRAGAAGESITVEMLERVPLDRRLSVTVSRLVAPRAPTSLPSHLVTFRDLTEQDRLDQMRADFVANASHELRTPLASLRGFVETLQGPARDDAAARQRFLGLMASQAMRMTRLIDDLLSLSRVEMRAHLLPRGTVDLNEVAAYVRQTLEPLSREDGVEVTVHRQPQPARIRGDRDEIVQLLQNLLQNAIKYGRPGGKVEVRIERAEAASDGPARLTAAVIDDGPGIAPEHLPRLTERFYRVNAASSREKGGTGLGLAIVKHIALRHRADLAISSTLGRGSRFAVAFDEVAAGLAEPT